MLASATAAVLLMVGVLPATAQGPGGGAYGPRAADSRIERHVATGAVRFMGARSGVLARATAATARMSASDAARAFLREQGRAFGIADADRELRVLATSRSLTGGSVVRFQQLHAGVPVIGAQFVVRLDRERNVRSLNGEALPGLTLAAKPRVSRAQAVATARAVVARQLGRAAGVLAASEPQLAIHDPAIMGGPGPRLARLVWHTEISNAAHTVREYVLIDALTGRLVLHFDQVEHVGNTICDAHGAPSDYPCTAEEAVVDPAASPNQEVRKAYRFAQATLDFYSKRFGRNSLDDAGLDLYSTVRFCPDPSGSDCPYANAFWDGSQMVYGRGLARADDVVGHELSHGVTQYTSNLLYFFQSGAINEAISDIFGEFIDQQTIQTGDTPERKWLVGEDVPDSIFGGALRNMKDPTDAPAGPDFAQPDRMSSPLYTADLEDLDVGGVHTNSGVANKAAYLIADGDQFNGYRVRGIGLDKSAALWYEVETSYLTNSSDYGDLATALMDACQQLIGTNPRDSTGAISPAGTFTANDCSQVNKAVVATEMAQPPSTPGAAPLTPAPVCTTGPRSEVVFSDDFEGPNTKWVSRAIRNRDLWFYGTNPYYPYSHSGERMLLGDDYGTSPGGPYDISDSAIAMATPVVVPMNGYLRFWHAFGFDDVYFGGDEHFYFDGGVVEYKTTTGSWSRVPQGWFTHNGYNGRIDDQTGNPLGAVRAFVDESRGYTASRIDLSRLAGQAVRFRFRIGTDDSFGDYGWFIDDVSIYRCG